MSGAYQEGDDTTQKPFGVSVAFLGLLFSVLASGCQSSDLAGKERELTSQVYGMRLNSEHVLLIMLTDHSVLLLPVSADDKLPLATYHRSHSNPPGDWERPVI